MKLNLCLKTETFVLCLSDIKFPTKNGVEVMKEAKEKEKGLTPAILIFISVYYEKYNKAS